MKGLGKFILVLALLLPIFAGAAGEFPPQIKTISDKTGYLLFLRNLVPRMFEQGAEYDVDLLSFIDAQNLLVSQLQVNPLYRQLAIARPPLAEISVFLKRSAGSEVRLDLDVESLKIDIRRAPKLLSAQRKGVVTANLELLSRIKPRGLFTGILSLYPPDLKQQAFRLGTNRAILQFLRKNPISQEVLDSKFKSERVGLPPKPTWEDLLVTGERLVEAEMTLARALIRTSGALGPGDYRAIFGADAVESERFARVLQRWGVDDRMREQLLEFKEQIVRQYYVKTLAGRTEDRLVLVMKEVPPYVGIFRGLAGSDCSTSYSFPYPYSPNERTYFIYSPEGHLLGYAMATIVLANEGKPLPSPRVHNPYAQYQPDVVTDEPILATGTPSLYVHTIAGPELSPRHVTLIMHALQKSTEELRVTEVLVPPKEQIIANINYLPVQTTLIGMQNSSKAYTLSHPDRELRDQFQTLRLGVKVDGSYDSSAANRRGVATVFDSNLLSELNVDYRAVASPSMNLRSVPSRGEAVLIALDLLTSERLVAARQQLGQQIAEINAAGMTVNPVNYAIRRQVAQNILEPYGILLQDPVPFPLNEALSNPRLLPLEEYYAELTKSFAEYGIELNDFLIQERPYFFYEGHLAAPDAMTSGDPRQVKRSIEFLVTLIKRWPNPLAAWAILKAYPKVVMGALRFGTFVQSLFEGDAADYEKLLQIHQSGFLFISTDYDRAKSAAQKRLNDPALTDANRSTIRKIIKVLDEDHRTTLNACERALGA